MRQDPHPSLLVHASFDSASIRSAVTRGDLVRLVPGRYLRRTQWDSFSAHDREIMHIIAAVSRLRALAVVSHASAAVLWGMPRLGPPPKKAHVTDTALDQTVLNETTVKHAGTLTAEDIMEVRGVLVTSPLRTAVDVALSVPFRHAVVVLDHCLRVGLATKEQLRHELGRRSRARGRARAARAIDFADHRANRPGESLSRVVMLESGVATPELQRRFEGPDGRYAHADFYWEATGRVGEFDGMTKYRDSQRWSGLPPEEVVINEKEREDWMRAHRNVKLFTRWTWRDAVTPGRLSRILAGELTR